MDIRHVNNKDDDFIELVHQLDLELSKVHGEELLAQYAGVNSLDTVQYVAVVYKEGNAIAGGGLRPYNETTAEIKRVFVQKQYRRSGCGKKLIDDLEAWAKKLGFTELILETGQHMPWAIAFYESLGYQAMPKYGDYINDPVAYCMKKTIA